MTHPTLDPELLERPRHRRKREHKARQTRKQPFLGRGTGPMPKHESGLAEFILELLIKNRKIIAFIVVGILLGTVLRGCFGSSVQAPDVEGEVGLVAKPEYTGPDLLSPVRKAPERFKRDSTLPDQRESETSTGVDDVEFSAGRDLVYVEDDRVWWESDNDNPAEDDECDHSMHAAMEIPFRRLSNLVAKTGKWELRVQEAYRSSGVHANKSLHKQGRALDVTVDRLNGEKLTPFEKIAAYEELAMLAWQAGFDWVYYENSRGTGPHIHASVRPDGRRLTHEEREAALEETRHKPKAMLADN